MSADVAPETLSSYEGFDFRGLWAGRSAVTRLETSLLYDALGNRPQARILEAGTGFGRLTPAVSSLADEYVGVDLDPTQLPEARTQVNPTRDRRRVLFAHANLFHLPFADGSFSAVVNVRVFHHIRDPRGFLAELRRVLAPGGMLLLGYAPKPTVATLDRDVRDFLQGSPRRITLSRADSLELGSTAFPIVVATQEKVREEVRDAGFEVTRELAVGPERLSRWLPVSFRGRAALRWPASFLFPGRFLLARRTAQGAAPFPAFDGIVVCPCCRAPVGPLPDPGEIRCGNCEFPISQREGIVSAVYAPEGSTVRRATDPGRLREPPE
ncbi:MAG: class I SAM-dependent methyltransferase [Thermoplasmata archaeon]|nr:class I SAM-dependent methyltransferase [Thermoplasmata archaeon]